MAYRATRFPGARKVLAADAVGRYDLRRTLMARMLADYPALSLLLLFGDVEMEQLDLDPRAGSDLPGAALNRPEPDVHGLIVAGNLLVGGAIHHARAPVGLSLYVLGGLRARNVAISGLELVVRGSVAVSEVLGGSGPQGGARLDGGVAAKLLISDGFPMLIGGRLAAPVLDTGRSRIGVVEGGKVRQARADVPAPIVLSDAVRAPESEGGGFSFERFRTALDSGRSALSADYLSGRTDLEAIRELRALQQEIDKAWSAGRFARAAQLLRLARDRGAPRAETGLRLADALVRSDHGGGHVEPLREALDTLNDVLGPDPDAAMVRDNPQALILRARILLILNEQAEDTGDLDSDEAFEQAWRDCSLAAVGIPTEQRAPLAGLMGHWLFRRRRYEDCLPYLRQSLAVEPRNGPQHGRLARALWLLDREIEALPHAGLSLELNPQDERMWFIRGRCHQVLGQVTEARLDLQTYLELHPDDELAVAALVEIGLAEGQVELAASRALAFIEAYPEVEGAAARFGRLLAARGLHDRAVAFLHRAMLEQPGHVATVIELAVSLEHSRLDHAGLTTALRSIEIDPDGDHLAYLRGECHRALGELDAAAGDLEAYLARFPDGTRAIASLGEVRWGQHRTGLAERLLMRAREIDPDDEYVAAVATRIGLPPSERSRVRVRPSHVSREATG